MEHADQTLAEIFGDIAQTFGLSRPAGQCFSRIWRAARPPCADDLVTSLGIARSNVSTALKELRGWNMISAARVPGDRKEYFTAPADPWEVLRLITGARQRQLVAPLMDRLLAAEAANPDARLAALHAALSSISDMLSTLAAQDSSHFARSFARLQGVDPKPQKKKKKK